MIDLNITLFIQMANFLILLWLLNLALFRPIRNIIRERNRVVDTFTSDIASLSDKARDASEQFEQKILEARKEGMTKVDGMKDEGSEEETQLIEATNREVQAKMEDVRKKIAADIQEARGQLQAQVQAFSVAVTEKILGRSIQ
ncbi:MAG: hypothetical protein ACLFVT_09155 [Syntrophobacteria bacterium]